MDDPEGFYRILKKDPLFDNFQKVGPQGEPQSITLEDLHSMVEDIRLNDKVPEEVIGVFDVARQLFILGYFKYRLFTVSAHYGFLAVEAALGNKYKAAYGKKELNLSRVIKKLAKDNLIPVEKKEFYDACRRLRNELSHLTTQKIMTPSAKGLQRSAELINDLYK